MYASQRRSPSRAGLWTVPREWAGETVFILAGGPSVLEEDLSLLRGRRVIAINSAWHTWPKADVLFFGDARWWTSYQPKGFRGLLVTVANLAHPGPKRLGKTKPEQVSFDPQFVSMQASSVTGAINLAMHYGSKRIVLLGVDGQEVDGRRHHHGVRYIWAVKPTAFEKHAAEFRLIAPSIARVGVEIINCSPVSTLKIWPKATLESCL